MKVHYDIGHPAHVHLFRNIIKKQISEGHQVIVVSRDKDITNQLLDIYKIPYICLSTSKKGLIKSFGEFLYRTYKILRLHQREKFDLAIGTSVSIGFLTLFFKIPSLNYNEDDDDLVPLYSILAYPFCSKILNPVGLRGSKFFNKRIYHNSYHELAYLHPDHFVPNPEVLKKYNLEENKYVIMRFSSLTAHHDHGVKGLSQDLIPKLENLLVDYKIIKSWENSKESKIAFEDMHHVLAFSKMLISDSQTMTMEAAVLGVPSIRYNSFVGRITVLEELASKYELTVGVLPEIDFNNKLIFEVEKLLAISDLENIFRLRRQKLLREKINLVKFMEEIVLKEIGKK